MTIWTCPPVCPRSLTGLKFGLPNRTISCPTERLSKGSVRQSHGENVIAELFELRNSKRRIPDGELEELLGSLRKQLKETR